MVSILRLFCDVDDFCQEFEPKWKQELLNDGKRKRIKKPQLSLSEVMTIVILFHSSGYRTFKYYYISHIMMNMRRDFPKLVSYNRFVELTASALLPLCCYLPTRKGKVTGISFVDSTPIAVCHNRRILSHKTFKELSQRGKSSMGWLRIQTAYYHQ